MICKQYRCLSCGKTTNKYNEGQCPFCKTLDTLELAQEDIDQVLDDLNDLYNLDDYLF